jgi:Right handed beta helix region
MIALFALFLVPFSVTFKPEHPPPALYVSPNGSDHRSCTRGAPCRTLGRADRRAVPGTTIYAAPGKYRAVTLRTSGTAAARIRWVSDRRWGAKISGRSSSPLSVVAIKGTYVDVEGFDVTGRGADGTEGINVIGSSSAAIGNHVHNIAIPCGGSRGGAGIDLSGPETGHDQKAIGNLVTDIGDQAGQPVGSCPVHTVQGIYPSVPNVVVQSNVVARAQSSGISSGHHANHLAVTNNTSVGNGENGIAIGGSADTSSYVANNIVAYNKNYGIQDCCRRDHPSGVSYVDNLEYGNAVNKPGLADKHAKVSGEIVANPLFADPLADNYRLRPASPAIDAGTTFAAPTTDFDGNPRPEGGAVNRGAFSPWPQPPRRRR